MQILKQRHLTANTQALGPQGGTEGHPSYAADPESQGPSQTTHSNKGLPFEVCMAVDIDDFPAL
jgi:hypothetical protein